MGDTQRRGPDLSPSRPAAACCGLPAHHRPLVRVCDCRRYGWGACSRPSAPATAAAITSLWRAAGGNEGEVGGLSAPSRPRPAPLRDAACSGQLVGPRSPPPRRSPHPSTSSVAASPASSDRIAAVCSAWVDFATAAVRVLLSAQLDPALPSRFRPSSKDFWSLLWDSRHSFTSQFVRRTSLLSMKASRLRV